MVIVFIIGIGYNDILSEICQELERLKMFELNRDSRENVSCHLFTWLVFSLTSALSYYACGD